MAEIMAFNQEKYVPCLFTGDKKEVVVPIGFHGDQLFEERARNVQWTFRDADTTYDQLRGLQTEFADWHAKVTLYKVSPGLRINIKIDTVMYWPLSHNIIKSCHRKYSQ